MKRSMLLVFFIGITLSVLILTYLDTKNYNKLSNKLYEEFKENELIGVDGEVNLINIKTKKENLNNELTNLYGEEFNKENYLKKIEDIQNSNKILATEIEKTSNEITNLENKKKNLNEQYNVLKKKYDSLVYSINISNNSNSYDFPLINQNPKYPTGCESVALTMLLKYYGINVTPDNIINNLKKGSLPYSENGVVYGGNPESEFVGNPYTSASYGVYEKPIAEVANMYKSGIQVKNNFPFSEIINIVNNGTPVLAWTSMGLSIPYISNSWIYKPTMETIHWKAGEHAVVIIGVEGTNIVIADPIGGKIKKYSTSLFEERYNYFGKKALYYL